MYKKQQFCTGDQLTGEAQANCGSSAYLETDPTGRYGRVSTYKYRYTYTCMCVYIYIYICIKVDFVNFPYLAWYYND